ncbi:MAG TPA: M24 family metallopeptidase [Methylomirabilota bacterium]|nr:M24 family metallopeptidase [Methylomirabilota bacterium]
MRIPMPRFSEAELARRATAVRARMAAQEVDCLLVFGAGRTMDVQYLVDWPGTRESYLIVPASGSPTLLVQFLNHVPNAERVARLDDVRWAGPGSIDGVVAALAERMPEGRRLGLVGGVSWRLAGAIRERLPRVDVVDFTSELRMVRAIASEEEIGYLREAAQVTDIAMTALERETRPGMRERELVHVVESAITGAGGTPGIHFMATTPMSAPTIGVPSQLQSERIIAAGDVLITEISGHNWGYGGQVHRAYAIGADPTAEYQRLHDVATEVFERIRGVLRDGASVAHVLDAAEVVHDRGLTIYDDLLHGTDQLAPVIQTRRTARHPQPESFVFRENMVVVVQPNVVTDGTGTSGLQVGETVRITKDGAERLHAYPMRFVRCG